MKKLISVFVLSLCLISPLAFAAVATVTTTEYGYSISGGTDATSVNSGDTTVVKALIFFPNTSTDTALITTGSGTTTFAKMTNGSEVIFLGDSGRNLQTIKVTLTAATDVLTIVTK